jgi:transcription initiation factor TFIIB
MISDKSKISNTCIECGGSVIFVPEKGEEVCSQCGLIASERVLDYAHSGKRAYTMEEKRNRARTGAPISSLLPDMGLSTVIDRYAIENPDLKRAAKWNTRITWEKRNLLIASTELKRISSNLNLPGHVKKTAFRLYKEAFEKKLLRGRSINGMIAACLYYAIRKNNIARTFQEIMKESQVSDREVRRSYSTLVRELKLKLPNSDPVSLIPRYAAQLELDPEIESICKKILKSFISRFSTSGKDPKGLVAGAIYLVCKKKNIILTQKEIAEIVGVTEVTLRSRYKELVKKLNIMM